MLALDARAERLLASRCPSRLTQFRRFGTATAIALCGFFVAAMNQEDTRKWILIVDDDSSVRLMLARVLSNEGYGVLTAANGLDALGLAETLSVDLVLLDLNMPGTNGWETLEELDAKGRAPAVIIITAMPHQQEAARAAGVATVLEKPLDFPRLIQTVSQVLANAVNSNNSA
jgi:CheY-like chemotaxis protein